MGPAVFIVGKTPFVPLASLHEWDRSSIVRAVFPTWGHGTSKTLVMNKIIDFNGIKVFPIRLVAHRKQEGTGEEYKGTGKIWGLQENPYGKEFSIRRTH